jgi:hypothetical protein
MSSSRPVNLPINTSGRHINFGVNPSPLKAQERFLDIPQRTVLSQVSYPPNPTGYGTGNGTGTLGIQYLQSDTIFLAPSGAAPTGTAYYVLPTAQQILSAFSDLNVGKCIRFWVTNQGNTNAVLVGNPTGGDTTFSSYTIAPSTGPNVIAAGGAGTLSTPALVPVTILFTSVNGSSSTSGQNPIPPSFGGDSTGTYQLL